MSNAAAGIAQHLGREAEAVCRHYLSNGRKQGNYWIVGDVYNARGRSLYVRLTGPSSGKGASGKWTDAATGEHGDLLDLIAANLKLSSLSDTLDEARRFLSHPKPDPPSRATLQKAPTGSPEAARRLWAMGQSIAGTLAEHYLAARGITGHSRDAALRFHPSCYYWREGQPTGATPETWPALLAKVTDNAGMLTGVHRTWLDPDTATKAPLDPNRKAMGNLLGHAVRFGPSGDVMAVGEGVETMLSLGIALPTLPMAAALSGAHLAAFNPPDHLRRLYIAVDADPTGCEAASTLQERVAPQGIETIPLYPAHGDFNDDLRCLSVGELRVRLQSQLAPIDVPALLDSITS